jgi:alpha-ribazole phosphatase
MRLYLIRHPQPEIAPGICYGSTDLSVSLQEKARALSALAALPAPDARLYASPLRRCSEFAAMLAAAQGFAGVTHDARLAEMHFGAWEMRAWNDIPRTEIDAWADDPVDYRPGDGESVLQMAQRVGAFHADLRLLKREHAVVVCHAGTIRLLLACQHGLSPKEMARHAARTPQRIEYGEMLVLDC